MNVIPFRTKQAEAVPLCPINVVDRRHDLVERMATSLLRGDATASERDALRWLTGRFPFYDIALLAEDALYEARQRAVGNVMRGDR
jgi:hypothetical protein